MVKVPLASVSNRRMAWQPKKGKLPWVQSDPAQKMQDKAKRELEIVVSQWMAITEEAGVAHSKLARKVAQIEQNPHGSLALERSCHQQKHDLFDNTLFSRAPSTLKNRAGHVAMYIRWCRSKAVPSFELSEDKFLAYADEARRASAPATQVLSVKKALNLASVLLELDTGMDVFRSPAIDGACRRSYVTKRFTMQSKPLSVQAVKALEEATVHEPEALDRVVAGSHRFACGSRMRGADLLRCNEELTLDLNKDTGFGFVDVSAHVTKRNRVKMDTMRTAVVGTAHPWGLHEDHWAEAWLQAREECGLDAAALGFFFSSVGQGRTFTDEPTQTDEFAIHLREILVRWGISPEEARQYTAHSLKSTFLSYSAKMGLPFKARRMLGYHCKFSERSTLVYSRDVMAWPLRHLGRALQLIREGYFNPDNTRSGYWTKQPPSTDLSMFDIVAQRLDEKLMRSMEPKGRVKEPNNGHVLTQELVFQSKPHSLVRSQENGSTNNRKAPKAAKGRKVTVATASGETSEDLRVPGSESGAGLEAPRTRSMVQADPVGSSGVVETEADAELRERLEFMRSSASHFDLPGLEASPKAGSGLVDCRLYGPFSLLRGPQKRILEVASDSSEDSETNNSLITMGSEGSGSSEEERSEEAKEEIDRRVANRASTDADTVMMEVVPMDRVSTQWGKGLGPYPFYSTQHKDSKIRHWSFEV